MISEIDDNPGEMKPVVLTPVDAPARGGIRLQHMMFGVGACAIVLWLTVVAGIWVLFPSLVMLVAVVIGMIAILLRRSTTQRESLLWALAIAAGRSLPLSDAALAFSHQYGWSFRWRVQLLASLLNEGVPLPEALGRVPGALSREAEVLVRTGYSTGTLARSLRDAAALRSSRDAAWGGTASRFLYLGWVLVVMQTITGFILYFIMPKFEAIFKDFGVTFPPLTIFITQLSHFAIKYFFLVGPLLCFAEVLIPLALLAGLFNSYVFWLDVSVLDSLFRRRHSALILRCLSLAVEGQTPIESAIGGLSRDYPSGWVRGRLGAAAEDVRQGCDWVEALLDHGMIRPADASLLHSAQRVGNLDWALRELADSVDRRLGYRLRFWLQMLFPLLIVALGALVFVIAVAYFTPLVRLIEALSG